MEKSLALNIYLILARRAAGRANRVLARRLDEGKEDQARIEERRGAASQPRPDGQLVWFHAASVGEALSIQELVRRLGEERPELSFLLTTGTRTSAQVMSTRMPPRALHQYVPLDAIPFVRRFLDHWKPDLAIWTESEFWPALMVETHKRGVPMLLINARMSDKSHRRWRWLPGAAKSLLSRFDHILVQDRRSAAHLRRLGVSKADLEVTGTLKEGTAALPCDEAERDLLAVQMQSRPVWLAASTHPGEEAIAAQAHRQALRSAHRMLLIIAPRHPERGPEIAENLAGEGWNVALRSRDERIGEDTQIYVADTLGEMGLWYRLAPISFVGGSMVEVGGHNPFEPAALGSAILHGPHMKNFKDIYERLTHAGAARQVADAAALAEEVRRLQSPDQAAQMAHAAWEVSSAGAQVTDRAIDLVLDSLDRREVQIRHAT